MKPGKSLERRTPLKAKQVSLKQGAKLPAASKRTKKRQPERAAVIAETHERAEERCEALGLLPGACWGPMDTHERLSRARSGGTSQYDPSLTSLLCRGHHNHVTYFPAMAEALGLSLPSRPRTPLLYDRYAEEG